MARQRELAIRAALGGGRFELIRQLMTEAMLLAVVGGGLGLVVAPWFLSALLTLAPPDTPRLDEIHLDGAVLLFSLGASTAAGLLAGLVPALQITQPHLMEVLTNGTGGTAKRPRARSALVVVETALAFVLAVGAGLMIRTISGLLEVPTGLASPERVLVTDMDLPRSPPRSTTAGQFRCRAPRSLRTSRSTHAATVSSASRWKAKRVRRAKSPKPKSCSPRLDIWKRWVSRSCAGATSSGRT